MTSDWRFPGQEVEHLVAQRSRDGLSPNRPPEALRQNEPNLSGGGLLVQPHRFENPIPLPPIEADARWQTGPLEQPSNAIQIAARQTEKPR